MTRNRIIILVIILLAVLAVIGFFLFGAEKEEPTPITEGAESAFTGKPLSPDKESVKRELVAGVGGAGTIAETPDFNVHYFAPDIFQVEIKNIDIVNTREKAIVWFKTKGFSEEDICKLPVTFYLNAEIALKLEGSGVIFNTLPDFCR